MTVWALGYDHAGYRMAQELSEWLSSRGDRAIHFGPETDVVPVDYARYCIAAAEAVRDSRADIGIVMGGTGQGEQIAANKVHGIRAALCMDTHLAGLARRDNDANVIALPARMIAPDYAKQIIDAFLAHSFEGGRHARRLQEILAYEDHELETDVTPRQTKQDGPQR